MILQQKRPVSFTIPEYLINNKNFPFNSKFIAICIHTTIYTFNMQNSNLRPFVFKHLPYLSLLRNSWLRMNKSGVRGCVELNKSQCARMDLNKRFGPEQKTITASKGTP